MSNTGIYKITSPTGKVYIGQSWDLMRRQYQYEKLAIKSQRKLYSSLLKHGWPAHTFEVLMNVSENVTQQMFDQIEQAYIDYYRNNGYELLNLREGGSHGKMSEESKEKRSKTQIGRSGVLAPAFGTKRTDEFKQKMSEVRKGRKVAPDVLKKRRTKGVYNNMARAVLQYDTGGNFIKEYSFIGEAAACTNTHTPNISKCCSGKRKTTGGFVWKYKEEDK